MLHLSNKRDKTRQGSRPNSPEIGNGDSFTDTTIDNNSYKIECGNDKFQMGINEFPNYSNTSNASNTSHTSIKQEQNRYERQISESTENHILSTTRPNEDEVIHSDFLMQSPKRKRMIVTRVDQFNSQLRNVHDATNTQKPLPLRNLNNIDTDLDTGKDVDMKLTLHKSSTKNLATNLEIDSNAIERELHYESKDNIDEPLLTPNPIRKKNNNLFGRTSPQHRYQQRRFQSSKKSHTHSPIKNHTVKQNKGELRNRTCHSTNKQDELNTFDQDSPLLALSNILERSETISKSMDFVESHSKPLLFLLIFNIISLTACIIPVIWICGVLILFVEESFGNWEHSYGGVFRWLSRMIKWLIQLMYDTHEFQNSHSSSTTHYPVNLSSITQTLEPMSSNLVYYSLFPFISLFEAISIVIIWVYPSLSRNLLIALSLLIIVYGTIVHSYFQFPSTMNGIAWEILGRPFYFFEAFLLIANSIQFTWLWIGNEIPFYNPSKYSTFINPGSSTITEIPNEHPQKQANIHRKKE